MYFNLGKSILNKIWFTHNDQDQYDFTLSG